MKKILNYMIYTLTLTHLTPVLAPATNVQIFNAYSNRTLSNQGLSGAVVPTGNNQINYLQLLALSEKEPFVIKKTLIVCSSSAQATGTTSLGISNTDGNGDQKIRSIDLYKNLDQYQNNELVCLTSIDVDGFTGITIPILYQNSSITFYFTIEKKTAIKYELSGEDIIKYYTDVENIFLKK